MTDEVVVGIDLGTTSCKASAFSLDGTLLGHGSASCAVNRPFPGWVEQDPLQYWESAVSAVRQALVDIDPTSVLALACCGHTPSLVLVNRAGFPTRPAIIWQDSRAAREAEWLNGEIADAQWRDWLGMDLPRNASYPPARLLWLRAHEPEVLASSYQALQPKDYLNYRLTGKMASDYWSSKGLIHLATGQPVVAYREALRLNPDLAPLCFHPHQLLGALTPEAAQQLGLPSGVPVAVGWSDAMCGMLGTGALAESGLAFDISGTSEIVGLTARQEPLKHEGVLVAPILDTDLRVIYGPTQTSGGAVAWFRENFGYQHIDERDLDVVAAAQSEGLLFLPYLEGERAPIWQPSARGVFFGISLAHTRAHFLRAVLEGVAFSIRHVLEMAELATGSAPVTVHLAGGGTTSTLWKQIRADVLGKPIQATTVRDAGTLGAAMLAAMATQAFGDIATASSAMVRVCPAIEPDSALRGGYDQLYRTYRQLYRAVSDLY